MFRNDSERELNIYFFSLKDLLHVEDPREFELPSHRHNFFILKTPSRKTTILWEQNENSSPRTLTYPKHRSRFGFRTAEPSGRDSKLRRRHRNKLLPPTVLTRKTATPQSRSLNNSRTHKMSKRTLQIVLYRTYILRKNLYKR